MLVFTIKFTLLKAMENIDNRGNSYSRLIRKVSNERYHRRLFIQTISFNTFFFTYIVYIGSILNNTLWVFFTSDEFRESVRRPEMILQGSHQFVVILK